MNLARYGTTLVFVVLAVIAILFALGGHWIIAFIFAIAAVGSWFVRGVKRSVGR